MYLHVIIGSSQNPNDNIHKIPMNYVLVLRNINKYEYVSTLLLPRLLLLPRKSVSSWTGRWMGRWTGRWMGKACVCVYVYE